MSRTKDNILTALRIGPHTSGMLAFNTRLQRPSIRRTIAELRRDGYDIITRGHRYNAEYVLTQHGPVAQADGDGGTGTY